VILVLWRTSAFNQIKDYVKPGDVLVLNNTKVLKARIKGRRKTGGAVEILLVRPLRDNGMGVPS